MNREALKTVGAVILIVGIVGTTFWYGNKQRHEQVKSDQTTQQQQNQQSSSSGTAQPTPAPAPAPAPAAGTSVSATVAGPAPQPTTIPETGSGFEVILPIGALVAVVAAKRASDKSLKRALLAS
jgi:cytoskeletal protein RodZ